MTHPMLTRLEPFIGRWNLSVPGMPATEAYTDFSWIEGGAFMRQESRVDAEGWPQGVLIIGADETTGEYTQCYSDSRGVHRIYRMTFDGREWRLWRDVPGFAQRFTGRFSDDGDTIEGGYELDTDGEWRRDFEIVYRRATG
ncbi:hypothetical protein LX16_0665 [Stackebrandtia albiflava]|uniref:DUF1579 domain-containing protein n=1 Tax=Stackebrandtia albiflava TaxID=406432 RepID=A0A562VAR0_9ACTN|nr:hypothetical protein [Stackebrandtia albiflava]TWJ14970.1 hypothetical protein LX16_0665 [Stackebrandtia albiflava]